MSDHNDTNEITFSKRFMIVLELISTEKSYIDKLTLFVDVFISPLESLSKTKGGLDPCVLVFLSDLKQIRVVNQEILSDLQEKADTWSETESTVGDIFLRYVDVLKLYKSYLTSYDEGFTKLTRLYKQSKMTGPLSLSKTKWLAPFVDSCSPLLEQKGCNWTGVLIEPVQRVARYQLLLSTLLKSTDESHIDHSDLGTALIKFNRMNESFDASVKRSKDLKMVVELQRVLGLVEDAQDFVRSSTVSFSFEKVNEVPSKSQKVILWLFTDSILIVKQTMFRNVKKSDLIDRLLWADLTVRDDNDGDLVLDTPNGSFMFAFDNRDTQQEWMLDILFYSKGTFDYRKSSADKQFSLTVQEFDLVKRLTVQPLEIHLKKTNETVSFGEKSFALEALYYLGEFSRAHALTDELKLISPGLVLDERHFVLYNEMAAFVFESSNVNYIRSLRDGLKVRDKGYSSRSSLVLPRREIVRKRNCEICLGKFGHIFNRSHICRKCTKTICSNCSHKAAMRLCVNCVQDKGDSRPSFLSPKGNIDFTDPDQLRAYNEAKKRAKKDNTESNYLSHRKAHSLFKPEYEGNFKPSEWMLPHSSDINTTMDIYSFTSAPIRETYLKLLKETEIEYRTEISQLRALYQSEVEDPLEVPLSLRKLMNCLGYLEEISNSLVEWVESFEKTGAESLLLSLPSKLRVVINLYTEFIENLPSAQRNLSSSRLVEVLAQKRSDVDDGPGFQRVFDAPIERVQKYLPIFQEIYDHTPVAVKNEKELFETALNELQKSLFALGRISQLAVLESNFHEFGEDIQLVSRDRHFVFKANLEVDNPLNPLKEKYSFYLFNDILLQTIRFHIVKAVPLHELEFCQEESEENDRFIILKIGNESKKTLRLICTNPKKKSMIEGAIALTLEKLNLS